MSNPFFKNHGPLKINEIFDIQKLKLNDFKDNNVNDVKDLVSANENDLTFFHNKNYAKLASQTKASYCVTLQKNNYTLSPVNTSILLLVVQIKIWLVTIRQKFFCYFGIPQKSMFSSFTVLPTRVSHCSTVLWVASMSASHPRLHAS